MDKEQFIGRVLEVLRDCDSGNITDEQGIKKLMKSSTKYLQSRFKEDNSEELGR